MADNIIIKITTEADLDAAQKQLKALTDEVKRQEAAMFDLSVAEKEDAETMKRMVTDRDKLNKKLRDNKKYYREEKTALKENIAVTKQSIKELERQVKGYKQLHGEGGKMVQRLRAMREELQRMEDAGEFGTKAFVDLAIAAGQLEDQIGDTQQRIRILSSDTKQIDALIGLGDGLAGGFYVATSAAEVFGNDLEGLQQAFYKVQAAMSSITGIQQVYNALQKDSVVAVVYGNSMEKVRQALLDKAKVKEAAYNAQKAAGVGITKLWTAAQWKLNAAMAANPIGVVIAGLMAIGAVIYGAVKAYQSLFTAAGKANRELRKTNKQLEKEQAEIAVGQAKREHERQKQIKATSDAQEKALQEARKRNASELELAQIKLKYAKQTADETKAYAEDEIKRGEDEIKLLKKRVDAQRIIVNSTRDNSNKQKKERQKLAEIEQEYYDALQKVEDLQAEVTSATNAETEAVIELTEARKELRLELQRAAIQNEENKLAELDSAYKTEEDYAEQLQLQKKIAQDEAQAQIDALKRDEHYASEKKRIELDLEKTLREIDEQEVQRLNENAKRETEIALLEAEAMTRTLNGKESVEEQKAIWQDYYNTRRDQITQNEAFEIEAINRSTDTEEVKQAKITQIQKQAQADREALKKEESEKLIQIDSQYLDELQRNVDKASRDAEKAQGGSKLQALEERFEAEKALYAAQQQQLDAQYDAGLITYQEYKNQEWEITKATADAEAQYVQDKMQTIADGLTTALGYMQEISDMAFDAITSNIQAELDALDEMYTTDAEEAKKNANKKYITEAEYEKKKAALEMKQAKYAKAQAIINAGINTALAIVTTLAQLGATPWGIAASVIAGAMGAAQIGIIASKPLAQYAKGRKGGSGEYALVGEKGPELMYVPQGASIVPNHYLGDMAGWEKFGVPALPNDMATAMMMHSLSIDYDKLGKAVAANIPNQHAVSVNVDRSGVTISDHGNRRTYLNHKYAGSWS